VSFTAILHFQLTYHSFTLHKAMKMLARSYILLKLSFRETLTNVTASTLSKETACHGSSVSIKKIAAKAAKNP
jgi:hypothetical protein